MPGSWFTLEFHRCRRGSAEAFGRIYTAWLAVQWTLMGIISAAGNQGRHATSPGALSSSFVGGYLGAFVVQHFLLLALVTPPLVAGLVSDERAKGTLAILLTTPLASWEMITAKLLGRLTDVGYLALLGLPLLAFTGGYGHLGLLPLLALPAVTVGLAFALGAASLLASVRSAQMRDAVLRVYVWCALAFGGAWGLAWGLGQAIPRLVPGTTPHSWAVRVEAALHWLSPLYVLDTFWEGTDPTTLAQRVLTAVLAWSSLGLAFFGLAVWRLRPTSLRLLNGPRRLRSARRRQVRAPVDDEPVRWKERVIAMGAILAGWPRVPRWLGVAAVFGATVAPSWTFLQSADPETGFLAQGIGMVFLFSLMIGIRTSGAVTGERERRTWEALLLTPLSNEEIVWGKFQGAAEAVAPYVPAYLIPALVLAVWAGAQALAVVAGLAPVMLAGMYFMGAMGIWWSVRLQSSWRSLLATLASGYAYAAGLLLLLVIPVLCLSCPSALALAALAHSGIKTPAWTLRFLVSLAGSLILAAVLVRHARRKILDAERWLEMERDGRTFGQVLARALRKHADRRPDPQPAPTRGSAH